jgi:hypothetical protein
MLFAVKLIISIGEITQSRKTDIELLFVKSD